MSVNNITWISSVQFRNVPRVHCIGSSPKATSPSATILVTPARGPTSPSPAPPVTTKLSSVSTSFCSFVQSLCCFRFYMSHTMGSHGSRLLLSDLFRVARSPRHPALSSRTAVFSPFSGLRRTPSPHRLQVASPAPASCGGGRAHVRRCLRVDRRLVCTRRNNSRRFVLFRPTKISSIRPGLLTLQVKNGNIILTKSPKCIRTVNSATET